MSAKLEEQPVDPAEWLANYNHKIARIAENARATQESLRDACGQASSRYGEVEVRVAPNGALRDLKLTAAARELDADRLAELILATARQAQRAAGERVIEIMSEHMGDGPGMELLKKHLEIQDTAITDDDYFANPPAVTQ